MARPSPPAPLRRFPVDVLTRLALGLRQTGRTPAAIHVEILVERGRVALPGSALAGDVWAEAIEVVKGIGALGVDVVEAREALEGPLRHRRRLGPIEVAQAALGVARLAWLARGRLPLADEVALREAGLRLTRAVEALDGCLPDADAERAAEEEAAAACEGLAVALGGDDRVVKMLRRAARALREG